MDSLPKLTDEEMDMCRKAFHMFDKDGSGTIDVKELRTALNALGQTPTDEELFVMVSQVDQDGSKEIEFSEFVHAIQINKSMSEKNATEQDTIDAWTALGGNADKSGKVLISRLQKVIEDFELRVEMDAFMGDTVEGGKVDLEYEEFRAILS